MANNYIINSQTGELKLVKLMKISKHPINLTKKTVL